MSDILDQIAGIKKLLQEQAEDCAQHVKDAKERQEIGDEERAEKDVIEASVKENLKEIMRKREDFCADGTGGQPLESSDGDALVHLIKENHESRMAAIQGFLQNCSSLRDEQRTELLKEISRLKKS